MSSLRTRLTLAQQYMIVSFVIMSMGTIVSGIWVARQIEQGVTSRTAAVTALYVDSYITPYLQELAVQDELSPGNVAFLERLLSESLLGQQILSFKVWSTDGTVLYSSEEPNIIGQTFPIEEGLAAALSGEVYSEVSVLERQENVTERAISESLIETYAPVRTMGTGEIIAISEFYQSTDALQAEIRSARIRTVLVVALVMLVVYLLLAGLVKQASETIVAQQQALRHHVDRLSSLLAQNEELRERVQRAAARTTTLNERYLRRISADLHDGPAQDLALAMLRMESLLSPCQTCMMEGRVRSRTTEDFRVVRASVDSALQELRTISAGLRMPEIEEAELEDTIRRAVRDYEQKTGIPVELEITTHLPADAHLSVKITLYRVIKEALNNGFHHAGGRNQAVHVRTRNNTLHLEVSDSGSGFDPDQARPDKHLGLVSMAERVELLGGNFHVESKPGEGTTVYATLPLYQMEIPHG